MKQKILILATAVLCFFASAKEVNAITVNFTTGNSYAEHQCWPIGNKVNPLNSTVPIQIGITDGSFHHYNAYLRNVNDLNTNIATLVTNATSGNTAVYNWYASTAGTYRVCVVVYDASGTELANTKDNVNYNFEVKSISAGTGSASSITANSAYLAGGSNVTGFGCQGVAYRLNGSSSWIQHIQCTGGITVSGLSPGTTYEYAGWADFITGTVYGMVYTFTTLPSQPGSISGPSNVCAGGGSQTYSIPSVSGATSYTWTLPNGWSGSSTTTSISATPGTSASSGYISVTANNSSGSSTASTLYVTVNTPPTAPTGITGTTTICSGSSTTLTASGGSTGSGCTYQWYSGGCGSGSVLGTGQSLTVSPTSNTTYYVLRVGTSPCGSTTTSCASVTVTVNTAPSQPGTISGTTPVCAGGGSQTYSISAVSGATSYTWTLPSGWSGSSTTTSISATPGTSAQSGNISVVANNSCGSSSAQTLSVTVNSIPIQPGTISGTTPVCAGSGAETYSISAVSGATSYNWTLPSGWSGSSTGTSISATPGSSAQSGNISVMANNSCGSSTARTLSVTVNTAPSQPGAISGSTSVIMGNGAQTYSISAVSGATSYTWTLPSGWSGSSTGTSISATPGSSAQSGNISVTANNNCGSSIARTLSVSVITVPPKPGAISGTTSVCAGSGAQIYSISAVSGATSYTWSLPSGWSGNSTSTSISATPGANAQSGNISVTANNSSGNSTASTLSVSVNIAPSQPGTISGSTSVDAGSGAKTYSISSVSGATSYTWILPSGWSGSSTSTSISATPGSSAQSGNISVTANNNCGSSSVRTLSVTVIPIPNTPSQPGAISGTTSVCAGNGVQTYSISAVSNATSYTWNLPSGWSGSSTGTSISATPGSSAQSGNISVTANNSSGSSPLRTLSVSVSTPPTAPTSISGTTTISSGQSTTLSAIGGSAGSGCTYQWYSGSCGSGSVLGTGQSITVSPTSNTTYYVRRIGTSPCNTTTDCALQGVTVISVSTCSVEPLLTTYWSQRAPYNNLVNSKLHQYYPAGSSNDYPTGCVATAMAQIMNYWKHPNQRTKQMPEYTTSGSNSFLYKIPVSAVEGTTTYNWSNMLNSYSSNATNTAVETLMYECGVSVHMNYTPGSSGADGLYTSAIGVAAVLPNYFGYDNGTKIEVRSNYTSTTWDAMLRNELNTGRPIYYVGYDCSAEPCAGHAFVCDGYRNCNNESLFHINWGWGTGYNDVWVVTSVLPLSSYKFETDQRVVTNIKPNTDAYIDPTNADNVNTFAISANALTGGYIIPSGTAIMYSGENKPFVFAANYGYEFDQVFIDGVPDATAKANGYYIFSDVTTNHSIIVTFKESVTGIQDIHSQKIFIYPNPTKNELFIQTDLLIKKVEISDLSGRNVKVISTTSVQNGVQTISLSSLLKGIYLVKVYTDNGITVSKIVKE